MEFPFLPSRFNHSLKTLGKRIQEGQRKSSEALSPPSPRCHRIRDHLSSPVMTPMRRVHLRTPVQHQFARRASLCTLPSGPETRGKPRYFGSTQAELRRWVAAVELPQDAGAIVSRGGPPIWLAMPCQKSTRPHCSSPAATMTLSSS
jgi:hypothetical protein